MELQRLQAWEKNMRTQPCLQCLRKPISQSSKMYNSYDKIKRTYGSQRRNCRSQCRLQSHKGQARAIPSDRPSKLQRVHEGFKKLRMVWRAYVENTRTNDPVEERFGTGIYCVVQCAQINLLQNSKKSCISPETCFFNVLFVVQKYFIFRLFKFEIKIFAKWRYSVCLIRNIKEVETRDGPPRCTTSAVKFENPPRWSEF